VDSVELVARDNQSVARRAHLIAQLQDLGFEDLDVPCTMSIQRIVPRRRVVRGVPWR